MVAGIGPYNPEACGGISSKETGYISIGGSAMERRGRQLLGRIEVNPKIMLGKPVIKGTRIPVELILRKLSEGATEEDLLDAYPHLTREDIQAALAYAAEALAYEETVAL